MIDAYKSGIPGDGKPFSRWGEVREDPLDREEG